MGQANLHSIEKYIKALQAIIPHDTVRDREIHVRALTRTEMQREKFLNKKR